ncbi:MAG: carbamoyltransferase HypF [Actinomycetes bacterium]|jgi:hydrogenase maturation protein HypF|nr:carbamoyltransferase HypF [Actinomycetes bacterium]
MKALDIHVNGIVQGVGFRPCVYKLARQLSLAGWVLNASDGVHIHLEGPAALVDSFPALLETSAPPASAIESIRAHAGTVEHIEGFSIRDSVADPHERTFISPDLATCPACLRELADANDRRYRYPFLNCTDCGPRFTIINDVPYDRPATSMRAFPMCPECRAEYDDPADRRFHAQPDACFACGPRLYFNDAADGAGDGAGDRAGERVPDPAVPAGDWRWRPGLPVGADPDLPRDIAAERARSNSIVLEAAEALAGGRIVAIKGLGGFQLACSALSETAVRRLRERKHRFGKPLAVMFANLEQAARYVQITKAEEALLSGNVRPIVLCRRRERAADDGADLAFSVAPGLGEVGVMLPYTPLHHLLLDAVYTPLIMTSGNLSEEPIVTGNAEALERLASVADAFLLHDRPIVERYDDSVARVVVGPDGAATQLVRRARGYAPRPVHIPNALTINYPVLAAGPEQKNTFALCDTGENEVFVSQHIGDLENSETLTAFEDAQTAYRRLFKITPTVLAHDLHPEYLSTKWARAQERASAGTRHPVRLIAVQHHHAHMMAAAAENGHVGPVIGVTFDGTGYGCDGSIWGGEVLVGDTTRPDFARFAHLRPFALPGGAGAIKRPIRIMSALLHQYGLTEHPGAAALRRRLEQHEEATVRAMVDKQLNTPQTSSMGRLFDAVAALLGVADEAGFEGSPAMMLEALSSPLNAKPTPPRYRFALVEDGGIQIDPEPVIRALLDDLAEMTDDPESELSVAELSRRFHDSVVTMVGDICTKAARATGISAVALSGGCFMNRMLIEGAWAMLTTKGLQVLVHRELPPNDGGVSFGQVIVANATLRAERSTG